MTKEDFPGWVKGEHNFKGWSGIFLLVKAGKAASKECEQHMLKDVRNSMVYSKSLEATWCCGSIKGMLRNREGRGNCEWEVSRQERTMCWEAEYHSQQLGEMGSLHETFWVTLELTCLTCWDQSALFRLSWNTVAQAGFTLKAILLPHHPSASVSPYHWL